ncbi:unnamed protein product [Durusdinium trenchii]|uniref:Uncharacterized protein n=1 Tax=Durusdinium trenchii TaxID=1381693 RepID=A0ABP0PL92_9DINO
MADETDLARPRKSDMLEIDQEEFGPSLCVPGVLGGSLLFAVVFGSLGLLLQGPQSPAQLTLQSLGGTLGAYGTATMHKASEGGRSGGRSGVRRLLRIALGAACGTGCSAVAFTAETWDLGGLFASAMLTALGSVLVALSTDPDYTLGEVLETILQKPP